MMRTALVAALLSTAAGPVLAAVIDVGPGEDIQPAIDRAQRGDTVRVAPGQYAPFQITRDGIRVESVVRGGAHVVAAGRNEPAIGSYNQSNVAIVGFRLTSRQGDGMKVGGSPGRMVRGLTVEGNIVESAALDGLKVFQAEGLNMANNHVRMAGASGSAGSGGNGNGDGGIDWVQVNNSRMVGNRIDRTNGWACAMVKTGSNGNLISGNTFRGCEVNGIDMAAPSTGAAAAANRTGLTAFNNRIEGNTISSGRGCSIAMHAQHTRDNRISGNTITGRDCGDPNGTNHSQANVSAGGGGGGSAGGGGAWSGAGAYNSGSARDLEGILATGCATAGKASGAVGVILGASGLANAPLQVAQQIQLVAQTICQQQSLLAQLRMLVGMDIRTVDDVIWALTQLDGMMEGTGINTRPEDILGVIEETFPQVFEGVGYGDMEDKQIIWNERVRDTMDSKTALENQVLLNRQAALQRAGRIEQAGRDSGGVRGAQLATNALLTEIMGAVTDQIAATTAHQRAMTEVQYRQEAEAAAAKADAKAFMAPLAEECGRCGKIPMNLFGGPNPAGIARSGRSANQVFGTGQ